MGVVIFGLSNGREVAASKIMLYPVRPMGNAMKIKAQGMSKMGSVSTGVGFWGSPEWAIGGALVTGIIQSALSDKNQKEGAALLAQAQKEWAIVKKCGVFLDVNDIENIENPSPVDWQAKAEYEVDLNFNGKSRAEIESICRQFNLPYDSVIQTSRFNFTLLVDKLSVKTPDEFVYDGDPFVKVHSDAGDEFIKWVDVSTYRFRE